MLKKSSILSFCQRMEEKRLISDCIVCQRYQGRTGEQKMVDLPQERLIPNLPSFTNDGVNYFQWLAELYI